MPTIFTRDSLRASVEAASGGHITVLYTAKGQPSYMYVVPRMNLEDFDLGSGPHPAFVVGGVTKSEFFFGVYQGIYKNEEFLSLPGVDPTVSMNFNTALARAKAAGPGWHMITNAEWSAIALWCLKNGFLPRGNNNYGQDINYKWETARRQDGLAPGYSSGDARTLTGSGPASWNHDGTNSGIADLNGNIWEWCAGLRLCKGEFQVLADNDAALDNADLGPESADWRAIDGTDGSLVVPTFTGSVSGNDYVATTPNSVRIANSGTADYTVVGGSGTNGTAFDGMTNPGGTPVSEAALNVMKSLCLFPMSPGIGGGNIYQTQDVERLPYRGGYWSVGQGAGVFALLLIAARSFSRTFRGSRPAFVI